MAWPDTWTDKNDCKTPTGYQEASHLSTNLHKPFKGAPRCSGPHHEAEACAMVSNSIQRIAIQILCVQVCLERFRNSMVESKKQERKL